MDVDENEKHDVEAITEFLMKQKSCLTYADTYKLEFQDLINFKDPSEDEDEEDPFEISLEDITEQPQEVQPTALTEEERTAIDDCTDPVLKRILILNRRKNMQLIQIHSKIKNLLQECERLVDKKGEALRKLEAKQKTKNQLSCVWKLAAPYFKDKLFFASPLNEDASIRRSRCQLPIYEVLTIPYRWTTGEFHRLLCGVKFSYNAAREKEARQQLRVLMGDVKDDSTNNTCVEVAALCTQLKKYKSREIDEIPPLGCNELIDWAKISANFLNERHTASECQTVWHILVHPDINKGEWTKAEMEMLVMLAKEYNNQNWDMITEKLGTNRTPFTACRHFFSKHCDKFKKHRFTPEEDVAILKFVELHKHGDFIPWHRVACHFTNRSKHQLYHRFTYFLSCTGIKRGKFSEAEDILLMLLVDKFGRNFKKCTEYMPHRSQVQLKSRYTTNLQNHIKKGSFTKEEDEIIYRHMVRNDCRNWTPVANQLKRCGDQVRQRFKILETFLAKNPEKTVADMPRRNKRCPQLLEKETGQRHMFLKCMAERFKEFSEIPTLKMIEESLEEKSRRGITRDCSISAEGEVKSVDDLLTDFFSNSMKITHNRNPNFTHSQLDEAVENAISIMGNLKVDLDWSTDFEKHPQLDTADLAILARLKNEDLPGTSTSSGAIFPPNFSNLVGLRSLLIKRKDYKLKQKGSSLNTSEANQSGDVLRHRNLFSERFKAIFTWPSILSLEKPKSKSPPPQVVQEEPPPPPVSCTKRNRSRKENLNDNETAVKRVKMDSLTNITHSQQVSSYRSHSLTLVDKKFVERLMNSNANLNIIKIDTVKGIDGVVRPVFKQNNPPVASQVISVGSVDIKEEIVLQEEEEDVEKLDELLRSTQKQSGKPGCSQNEMDIIKEDVQLLEEILKYEKIKP